MSNSSTFKSRVAEFWKWYASRSQFFFDTIEAGKCPELQEEVSAHVQRFIPEFAWVFGPGVDGGHSFTISAEGDTHQQFLTSYWLSQAPQLSGWTFYSTKQPAEIHDDIAIEINDLEFVSGNLMLDTEVDLEQQRIDIRAWDPTFEKVEDENLRYQIVFIWLDEALGETGTQSLIGAIDIEPNLSENAFPVSKLKSYTNYIAQEHEWELTPPDETYSTYQLPEPSDAFPRADIIAGSTCNMSLVETHFSSQGQMEDVLEGTGAEFWYVAIDPTMFPEGKQVELRGQFEDKLDECLRRESSGRVFGGAMGFGNAYIDLVIFDGNSSLRLIEEVLHGFQLKDRYQLLPFATV